MPRQQRIDMWVVYQVFKGEESTGVKAVCTQQEWDQMRLAEQRDRHTLIKGHLTNEGEAERLARGTAGDPAIRLPRRT
jgi:hypothetical protein